MNMFVWRCYRMWFVVHNVLSACELALLAWTSSAPLVSTCMLSGAMLPYALAALTMKSVGEALYTRIWCCSMKFVSPNACGWWSPLGLSFRSSGAA